MSPRRKAPEQDREQDQARMVPQEQYGPWKGMRPPHTHPSAVPADRYRRPSRSVPFRDVLAGFPSALVFLAGAWLMVCPWLIDHPATAAPFGAAWNDVLAGVVLVGLGGIRAVAPFSSVWAGWLGLTVGGWLVAAPFALGYGGEGDVSAATVNDLAVGSITIVLTVVSLALTAYWRRTRS